MYLDNGTNPVEFQGHRSNVKVTGPDFRILYHCKIGQKRSCTRQLMNRCTQLDELLHVHVN